MTATMEAFNAGKLTSLLPVSSVKKDCDFRKAWRKVSLKIAWGQHSSHTDAKYKGGLSIHGDGS